MAEKSTSGFSTLGIHAGAEPGRAGDPVVPPIVQSATFFGGRRDDALLYTRYGNNPLQLQVGRKLAALEGTEAAVVLGSGMGAIAATTLSLVERGDHIVAARDLYGATRVLFETELPRRGVSTTFVDPEAPGAWRRALRKRTRMVYLEAPTNPTLRVPDPREAAAAAAPRGIPVVMDATFATPINLRPARLGVDVVIHSATKYFGGHSDLIGGVVAGSAAHVTGVVEMMKLYGAAADPHMVWLLDRGLRTLEVRVRRHNENALTIARFLEERPEVRHVSYPGLEGHPDFDRAHELMPAGAGGMVSFVVRGGGGAADRVMDALRIIRVAPSLGGVESLVSQPRYTSHSGLSAGVRRELGIPDGFLRLSVGLEDADDLVDDLGRALDRLSRPGRR